MSKVRDIFQIREYEVNDEKRSEWVKVGVAFPPNKDDSINIQLYLFPGCSFQIRDRKEKEDKVKGSSTPSKKSKGADDIEWDE